MDPKVIGLLAAMLIPMLLPFFLRRYGIRVPARKWAVWYIFWAFLASMVIFQIYTIEHVLVVEPRSIEFGSGENTTEIFIANNGSGAIRWDIERNVSWLLFEPNSGRVGNNQERVEVSLNRSALPPGVISTQFLIAGRQGERSLVEVRIIP